MSLKELQEELKEQIKQAEEAEEEKVEEVADAEEAPKQEEEKEAVVEEKKEEKVEKVEEKKEPFEDKSEAAFGRLRREAAANKKRADEAEARAAAPKEQPEEAPIYAPDPELEEIKKERVYSKAEREFKSMEEDFKRENPEYGAIANEYGIALAQSIRIQNPRLSEIEITERTKRIILEKAGSLMSQGYNPIEEMYHQAKELGFTGKSFAKKEAQPKEELRPDMKKVSDNRKKSAGMAASGGEAGEQDITRDYIERNGMPTNAEFAKLTVKQKQRLFYG